MKIRLFDSKFTKDISKLTISSDNKNYHYLVNVIKVKQLQSVFIFSSELEGEFIINSISKKEIVLTLNRVIEMSDSERAVGKFSFILPIIKQEKLNLIAKQIVEIGFGNIYLAKTDFSQKIEINYKKNKFEANITEAVEQSEGVSFPNVFEPESLMKILSTLKDNIIIYGDFRQNAYSVKELLYAAVYLEGSGFSKRAIDLASKIKDLKKITVLIGPEGGLSLREVELLSRMDNCIAVNLGERKQRCETASVSLMAIAKGFFD